MMYILFNNDGSVNKRFLNEFIQQGDDNSKKIFVSILETPSDQYEVGAIATLPDQTKVALPSEDTSLEIDGQTYQGKEVSITADATILQGVIRINLVLSNNNETLITYNVYLTINETGLGADDPVYMSVSEYARLLEAVGEVSYIGKADKVGPLPSLGEIGDQLVTDVFDEYIVNGKPFVFQSHGDKFIGVVNIFENQQGNFQILQIGTNLIYSVAASSSYDFQNKYFRDLVSDENRKELENAANKVTTLSSSSSDAQYPSAKVVWDSLQSIQNILAGKNRGWVLSCTDNIADIKEYVAHGAKVYLYPAANHPITNNLDKLVDVSSEVANGDYDNIALQNPLFNTSNETVNIKEGISYPSAETKYLILRYGDYSYILVRINFSNSGYIFAQGEDIFVIQTNVPDRWSFGTPDCYALEAKADLTNYVTLNTAQTIKAPKTIDVSDSDNVNLTLIGGWGSNKKTYKIRVTGYGLDITREGYSHTLLLIEEDYIRMVNLRPAGINTNYDIGYSNGWEYRNLHLKGKIYTNKNANFGLAFPDTTSWVVDKEIATTDEITKLYQHTISCKHSDNTTFSVYIMTNFSNVIHNISVRSDVGFEEPTGVTDIRGVTLLYQGGYCIRAAGLIIPKDVNGNSILVSTDTVVSDTVSQI